MTPQQYCQERAAGSGSSFYYSFLFLPSPRREAIIALYAYCREVDDVVDECSDPQLARIKLAWWREEVARLFAGEPEHPVTRALLPVVAQFDLPQERFQEIIDGMEMDLGRVRYPDFKALHLYCYRVASVVGLMAAEIFGYQDRQTLKYAHDLGLAFQLTNIVRDVAEDAERGRIYLPQDELAHFGVEEQALLERRDSDNLRQLLQFQTERARHYYQSAFAKLPERDRFDQRAGLIMAAVYLTTLDRLEAAHFPTFGRRIRLSPWRKLWLAWRTARKEAVRHRRLLAQNKS